MRPRATASTGLRGSSREDQVPGADGGQVRLRQRGVELDVVGLGMIPAGMGQAMEQFPVVGEHQEPARGIVQASGIDQPAEGFWQEVVDRGSPLRIVPGGHDVARLVEQDHPPFARRLGQGPVAQHFHGVVDLEAEVLDHDPVYGHPPSADEVFHRTARPEPAGGQKSIDPHGSSPIASKSNPQRTPRSETRAVSGLRCSRQ